jgi:hypothetical protein
MPGNKPILDENASWMGRVNAKQHRYVLREFLWCETMEKVEG